MKKEIITLNDGRQIDAKTGFKHHPAKATYVWKGARAYKPSEINLLQRQIITADKINITFDEMIEELRAKFKRGEFTCIVTQIQADKFTVHSTKMDEELFIEQYRESLSKPSEPFRSEND